MAVDELLLDEKVAPSTAQPAHRLIAVLCVPGYTTPGTLMMVDLVDNFTSRSCWRRRAEDVGVHKARRTVVVAADEG